MLRTNWSFGSLTLTWHEGKGPFGFTLLLLRNTLRYLYHLMLEKSCKEGGLMWEQREERTATHKLDMSRSGILNTAYKHAICHITVCMFSGASVSRCPHSPGMVTWEKNGILSSRMKCGVVVYHKSICVSSPWIAWGHERYISLLFIFFL